MQRCVAGMPALWLRSAGSELSLADCFRDGDGHENVRPWRVAEVESLQMLQRGFRRARINHFDWIVDDVIASDGRRVSLNRDADGGNQQCLSRYGQ